MEQVMTAPTEDETLIDTFITTQPRKRIRWDMNLIQSPNGDHPDAEKREESTASIRETDEDDFWESEGWRYIETTTEEGQVKRERVPLTAYELLHPEEDYVIVQATPHGQNATYIDNAMSAHLTHDSKAIVLNDVRTDFNLLGVKPVSPDISVIFDVPQKKPWHTFDCQEEGGYPSVIFEITSPKTRENDFGEKWDYYRRAGVSTYVILDIIYDKTGLPPNFELFVYELIGNQYVRREAGYLDRYWLPPLNVLVGLGEEGILCYDETGMLLMSHEEAIQALQNSERERDAAQQLVDEHKQIAEQEAARAVEQAQIAEQEAARAVEQERIAEQEAARAMEQERIAQQERMIAEQEATRAAEQERIASEALQAQLVAEAKIAELLARMAELEENPKK